MNILVVDLFYHVLKPKKNLMPNPDKKKAEFGYQIVTNELGILTSLFYQLLDQLNSKLENQLK